MKRKLFERYHPLPFLTTFYKLLVTKFFSLKKGCERTDNNLKRIFLRHHFLRVIHTFLPSSFYTIARIVGLSFIHSQPAADKRFTLWPLLWKVSLQTASLTVLRGIPTNTQSIMTSFHTHPILEHKCITDWPELGYLSIKR